MKHKLLATIIDTHPVVELRGKEVEILDIGFKRKLEAQDDTLILSVCPLGLDHVFSVDPLDLKDWRGSIKFKRYESPKMRMLMCHFDTICRDYDWAEKDDRSVVVSLLDRKVVAMLLGSPMEKGGAV